MSEWTDSKLTRLLESVEDPVTGRDLVASGWVRGVGAAGSRVSVDLRFGYPAADHADAMATAVRDRLEAETGIDEVVISTAWRMRSHRVQDGLEPVTGVRNIIAVGSGKGGVGKSTVAVNLALALAADGARVGVLDADIYGPSIPTMLGVSGRPQTQGRRILPQRAGELQVMSIGFLVDDDTPMIWRGPMVTSALQQLLGETDWDDLDVLVIDLPPGTGDIQLTLAQKVPVAGAVIVTTPQDIALLDARKALQMFRKVRVPVLGVIENMALYVCPECGHEDAVFGAGGGARIEADYDVPLLGQLPLDRTIREALDAGRPTVQSAPDSAAAGHFRGAARRLAGALSQQPLDRSTGLPGIELHNA